MNDKNIYFNDLDTFYLANHLSLRQLREEVRKAELAAGIARQFRGTEYESPDDSFPFDDFKEACLEAIDWLQATKPNTKPVPGRINITTIKAKNDIVAVLFLPVISFQDSDEVNILKVFINTLEGFLEEPLMFLKKSHKMGLFCKIPKLLDKPHQFFLASCPSDQVFC